MEILVRQIPVRARVFSTNPKWSESASLHSTDAIVSIVQGFRAITKVELYPLNDVTDTEAAVEILEKAPNVAELHLEGLALCDDNFDVIFDAIEKRTTPTHVSMKGNTPTIKNYGRAAEIMAHNTHVCIAMDQGDDYGNSTCKMYDLVYAAKTDDRLAVYSDFELR
jgi:hypothetical protein